MGRRRKTNKHLPQRMYAHGDNFRYVLSSGEYVVLAPISMEQRALEIYEIIKGCDSIERVIALWLDIPTETARLHCLIQRHHTGKVLDINKLCLYVEMRTETNDRAKQWGYVYFIRNLTTRSVKIGWAKKSPLRRLDILQVGNEHELRLETFVQGSMIDEHDVQALYPSRQVRGEWFIQSEELDSLIEKISAFGGVIVRKPLR